MEEPVKITLRRPEVLEAVQFRSNLPSTHRLCTEFCGAAFSMDKQFYGGKKGLIRIGTRNIVVPDGWWIIKHGILNFEIMSDARMGELYVSIENEEFKKPQMVEFDFPLVEINPEDLDETIVQHRKLLKDHYGLKDSNEYTWDMVEKQMDKAGRKYDELMRALEVNAKINSFNNVGSDLSKASKNFSKAFDIQEDKNINCKYQGQWANVGKCPLCGRMHS